MSVSFTLDLENHRRDGQGESRYRENARRILEAFAEHEVAATVFVVGDIVRNEATFLREIADAGHELALHSDRHVPLTEEHPGAYGERLRDARRALEDVAGSQVSGYRAPVFSLTPATTWVVPQLLEAGFRYSSSVLPAAHPLFGFEHAPPRAFRWPGDLVELPVPLLRLAGSGLPFLGGIYLRYLPRTLQRRGLESLDPGQPAWSYIHPYDVDASEPYYRFPGTSAAMSFLLWRNRARTLDRLRWLMHHAGAAVPLGARVANGEFDGAERFTLVGESAAAAGAERA